MKKLLLGLGSIIGIVLGGWMIWKIVIPFIFYVIGLFF